MRVALRRGALRLRDGRPSPWRLHFAVAVGLVLDVEAYLLYIVPPFVAGLWLGVLLAVQTLVAALRGRRIIEELTRNPSHGRMAAAVADALHATGLSPRGAAAVIVTVKERGQRRWEMVGVPVEVASAFATALDELLAPATAPGYVVRLEVLHGPVDLTHGLRAALGRLQPDGEVWHRVPTLLGTTVHRAEAFATAWDHWVGGEAAVYPVTAEAHPDARELARAR